MLNLIVINGSDRGRVYRLSDKMPQLIGRLNASLSVCLSDQAVSRIHAELISNGCGWAVNDMHSTNGTFVNGKRVSGRTLLTNGDQLRLGRTVFVVDIPADTMSKTNGRVSSVRSRKRIGVGSQSRGAMLGGANQPSSAPAAPLIPDRNNLGPSASNTGIGSAPLCKPSAAHNEDALPTEPNLQPGIPMLAKTETVSPRLIVPVGWILLALTVAATFALIVDIYYHPH